MQLKIHPCLKIETKLFNYTWLSASYVSKNKQSIHEPARLDGPIPSPNIMGNSGEQRCKKYLCRQPQKIMYETFKVKFVSYFAKYFCKFALGK